MRQSHFAYILLACSLACDHLDPFDAKSSGGACEACPRSQPPRFSPGTDLVEPASRRETFVPGRSLLFTSSSRATNIALLSARGVPPTPQTAHSKLTRARRELYANPAFDVAVLLEPEAEQAALVCPGDPVQQVTVKGVNSAANAVAMARVSIDRVLVVAFEQTRETSQAASEASLSAFVVADNCSDMEVSATTLSGGPYEVQALADAIYISSPAGLQRVDVPEDQAAGASAAAPSVANVGSDAGVPRLLSLQVGSNGGTHYLIGLDGTTLTVVSVTDGEALEPLSLPTDDASVAPAGFWLTPRSTAVLLQGATGLLRYALPHQEGAAPISMSSTAQTIAFGQSDDCALGFTERQSTLEKLNLNTGDVAPINLPRPIESVHLFCRPGVGEPSCCDGVALVEHASDPGQAVGRTEGYSLVDLRTSRVATYPSSARLRASAAIDDGNALLLAHGDERRGEQHFEVVTPFSEGDEFAFARAELPAFPMVAGAIGTNGSLGYVGLSRADGGVLFVTRPSDSPIVPASYLSVLASDFYLQDRVQGLGGASP